MLCRIFFELTFGIRQGGMLSPYLFAVYIDSVLGWVKSNGLGCYIKAVCVSVFLYANVILLLAPSLSCLQQLLYICEDELQWLDLTINARKSACIRIGPRFYSVPQCSHCKRCTSYDNSVCLSVRLSVCPSHARIVSKRRHVARCSLHGQIAKCV